MHPAEFGELEAKQQYAMRKHTAYELEQRAEERRKHQ